MKAIILVGGEGTRLRPLTCQIPKAMVPVLNRPFLEHVIENLREHSIDTIILTICYRPENIQAHFGDGSKFGVKMLYIEEKSPLGTAGGVKNAESFLDGPVFVLNGDVYSDLDYTSMLKQHRNRKAAVSIALTSVEDPSLYGVVEADAGGRIRRFIEKPKTGEATTNMINAGTYILEPGVLHNIPGSVTFSFERQLFPLLLAQGQHLYSYPSSAYWIDIGTPEKYLQLNHDLLGKGFNSTGKSSGTMQKLVAECVSKIGANSRIEGRVVIGENATIGEQVVIKGPSVIGSDCKIGEGAKLEGVVLWDGVNVGRNARLSNCIAANRCLVNENSCVGNGCVIGDDVVVTPDCVIPPGSKIWPGTLVY